MNVIDEEPSSRREICVTGQRKILKAARSKQCLEKVQQKQSQRNAAPQLDQLEVIRVLGEGTFGEVVLAVDRNDPSIAVAVKRISLRGMDNEAVKQVKKEALLQRAVNKHKNILKYISMRTVGNEMIEFYLEYAGGGELFDQIEPDVGIEPVRAQDYFRQILDGLQYLHSNGIAHRDIKPENLLLDENNVLKISDFGMATIFKHNGSERLLTTKCGTLPYAAPEVLDGDYRGEPVDIWSAGVVLVTMLVGELPWDAPVLECEQYAAYVKRDGDLVRRPWCRMDNTELSLLKLILCEDIAKRGTINRINNHPWCLADLSDQDLQERRKISEPGIPIRKTPNAKKVKLEDVFAATQPAKFHSLKPDARPPLNSISQPAYSKNP
ncbi:hypothetical protein FO519_000010 [Halicephalobus sp. NKZ332]|nr:hypothetical protein FO519_000010 [Halicephalobus sp. NKZ332]